MMQVSNTVKHLIIINILFFVGTQVIGTNMFDILSLWFPTNPKFEYWQLVTHMFMHSQTLYLHILFNMLGLWMFGTPLEQIWGQNKFLFFYFSCGIGAVGLHLLVDYYELQEIVNILTNQGFEKQTIFETFKEGKYNTGWQIALGNEKFKDLLSILSGNMVGASGAVMGLLAGFGINFPNAKLALIFLPVPIAAKYFIPILLIYEISSGFFGWSSVFGNIAHFAHVGGAIVGGIISFYWKKNEFRTY